ncbi:MAG: Small subunit (SSU) processome component [Chrysothrix sp. TS-e1954]|nr:MAG: Small subunit (SSU) processome component [Chrysothrix sp. TS-e1954]
MESATADSTTVKASADHALAQPLPKKSSIAIIDAEKAAAKQRREEAKKKFGRGAEIRTRTVKDRKLRANLKRLEDKIQDTTLKARDAQILQDNDDAGFLEPENDLEKTYRVAQRDIIEEASTQTARKAFNLQLNELGPYTAEFSRNSRELLLAGRKGHVATMDWREGRLGCEVHLGETVRDAVWLSNAQRFAVAQKKYTYIYDRQGIELHALHKLIEVTHMKYLDYHYLLATIGNAGVLKYLDVSTGMMVAETPTKLGAPTSFQLNPYNAVMAVGDRSGRISLWSPNSSSYLAKIQVHKGPTRAIAIDRSGRYMVSTGQDLSMSLTDLRMTKQEVFREVNRRYLARPGISLDISDTNLIAVGWGSQCSIFQDVFDKSLDDQKVTRPYMAWGGGREGVSGTQNIERVRFCPFEDVLGVSHTSGFSSMIVPGAGGSYDSLEISPYETVKQRQETEVRGLLQKLQPETISLDPNFIGKLDLASAETRGKERDQDRAAEDPILKIKNRGKGKNSSLRRHLRKKGARNIVTEERLRLQQMYSDQKTRKKANTEDKALKYGPALARFAGRDR